MSVKGGSNFVYFKYQVNSLSNPKSPFTKEWGDTFLYHKYQGNTQSNLKWQKTNSGTGAFS